MQAELRQRLTGNTRRLIDTAHAGVRRIAVGGASVQGHQAATSAEVVDGPVETRRVAGRFWEVDVARGIAIGMMVVYHLFYDLDVFGPLDIDTRSSVWSVFAAATAGLFFGLVGLSLTISASRAATLGFSKAGLFLRYVKRGLWIFSLGMVISAVTWVLGGDKFIPFGTLHFIGLSIPLAYLFLRFHALNLGFGIGFLAAGTWLRSLGYQVSFPWLLWLGIPPEGFSTFDYRPLLPWFGFVLIGVYLGRVLYRDGRRRFAVPDVASNPVVAILSRLGRYALLVYLIHQPLLIAILLALGLIDLGSFA